jgi:hypothetical protein
VVAEAISMENLPEIRQIPPSGPVRILMICPRCGHENLEAAPNLHTGVSYLCGGDGCDYRFDLAGGSRKRLGEGLSAMWRRFYAVLSPAE